MWLPKAVAVISLPLLLLDIFFCAAFLVLTWSFLHDKWNSSNIPHSYQQLPNCCYTPSSPLQDAAASAGCEQPRGSWAEELWAALSRPQITEQRDRKKRFLAGLTSSTSCAVMVGFAPALPSTLCGATSISICDASLELQTWALLGCLLNVHLILWHLCILVNNHPAKRFSPQLVASCKWSCITKHSKGKHFAEERVSNPLTTSSFFNTMFPSGGKKIPSPASRNTQLTIETTNWNNPTCDCSSMEHFS